MADRFPDPFADLDVCDITTVGRRSNAPHTVEIWFALERGTIYLISGNGERCDWLRNAEADARVVVELGGERRLGRARRVVEAEERRRAGRLIEAKYPGFEGEADIGLTRSTWLWDTPVLAIEGWDPA